MLRRSLLTLLAFTMLALGLTVGFAALGLSGPAQALDDAARALDARQFGESLRLLELAARSSRLQREAELSQRLLALRYRAHQGMGNAPAAVVDLERLIARHRPDDLQLHIALVENLVRAGRTDQAVHRADALLTRWPDDGRGLELAGEARQVQYQQELRAVVEILERDVHGADREPGHRALRDYVYRPAGDPVVREGEERLAALVSRSGIGTREPGFTDRLQALRTAIQGTMSFYRRSLVADGQPVSAWQGWAHALQEGGRLDDLVALSEIYLLRFDHVYTLRAAEQLVRLHRSHGRPAAALATARRHAPFEQLRQRLEQDNLEPQVRHLLLERMRSALALGDRADAQATMGCAQDILDGGINLQPEFFLMRGLVRAARGGHDQAAESLRRYLEQLPRGAPPSGPDPWLEAVQLRAAALAQSKRPEDRTALRSLLDLWVQVRPRDRAAFSSRARFRLQLGQVPGAFEDAGRALDRAFGAEREAALQLLASTANPYYAPSGQDGPGLLARCLREGRNVPDVDNAIGLLLVARAALDKGKYRIALATAREASSRFLWAKAPRLLMARAAERLGDLNTAIETLRTVLSFHPGDPAALIALRLLHAAEPAALAPMLFDLVRATPPDRTTAALLLSSAVQSGDPETLGAALAGAVRLPAPTAELLASQAAGLLAAGALDRAAALLAQLRRMAVPPDLLQQAQARDLAARAHLLDGAAVARAARDLLAIGAPEPDELLAAAQACAAAGHLAPAHQLLSLVLERAGADARTGTLLALDGSWCLQLGLEDAGRERLLAALGFPATDQVLAPLALLLLRAGRIEDARAALDQLRGAESCPLLQLRLRDAAAAEKSVAARRAAHPHDPVAVVAHGLLADLPEDLVEFEELAAAGGDPLVDLILLLEQPATAPLAIDGAAALRARLPDSEPAALLHARALEGAGRFRDAAAVLEDRVDAHPGWFLVLEAARLGLASGNAATVLPPSLQNLIVRACASPEGTVTEELTVCAALITAVRSAKSGARARALEEFVALWRGHPVASGVDLANMRSLVAAGRAADALAILSAMEPTQTPGERHAFLEVWYRAAATVALGGENPKALTSLGRRARKDLEHSGHHAAWSFLVQDDLRRHGALPTGGRIEAARRDHLLTLTVTLLDRADAATPGTILAHGLELLSRLEGTDAALNHCDRLLRRNPGSPVLWSLRARMLDRLGRTGEALLELRSVVRHLPTAELVRTLVEIAGISGDLQAQDGALLVDILPRDQRLPARDGLAFGLIAYRAGEYENAVGLLAGAGPQDAAAALYFSALAELGQRDPARGERARALFARLAAEHGDHSLAANAQDFVDQLGG